MLKHHVLVGSLESTDPRLFSLSFSFFKKKKNEKALLRLVVRVEGLDLHIGLLHHWAANRHSPPHRIRALKRPLATTHGIKPFLASSA